ncbi:MAG: 50S ribosomal protein L15 [Leptospiraceae bacterium]|nr:50S ribosomal protein L15 [Leptospiraceae bacterium]MCP5501956.1 50S ribosomal protein L15 [Leptospiraceae bacterium]
MSAEVERRERNKQAEVFGKEKEKKKSAEPLFFHIHSPEGSKKDKVRVGRGTSSGCGKTSSRGQKGQKARATGIPRGFEGGQMPLHRRLPKRGFTSKNHKYYQPVNLSDLNSKNLSGEITPELLFEKGLIRDVSKLIKILGKGELGSTIHVSADKCSSSALEKIKAAGGDFKVRELKATATKTEA